MASPQRGKHPWTPDEAQSWPLLRQALDMGINFFDTANSYSDGSSEEIVGRALCDFVNREVAGHTPVPEPVVLGNVYHIDTGGWRGEGYFTLLELGSLSAGPAL